VERKSGWRPNGTKEALLVWSEYAQDLYVQVSRVFGRLPIWFVHRGLASSVNTLYAELVSRFQDLGVQQVGGSIVKQKQHW
jgi:hypothetical protein